VLIGILELAEALRDAGVLPTVIALYGPLARAGMRSALAGPAPPY
jgi:hypothetical protein